MNSKINISAFLLIIILFIQLLTEPVFAQRKRPTSTPPPTGSSNSEPASANQIEQRNQALLQQIMSLQKERDFYKDKITSWTKLQMNSAKEKPAAEEPKPKDDLKPTFPSGGMAAYYLPITPDILDTLLCYRSQYHRPAVSQNIVMNDDSLLHNAQRLAIMGRYSEAREVFEQVIRSRKVRDVHFLEYGKFLYKIGDHQRALEMLSGVTGGNRELAVASYYKGRIYQMANANTVAEIDFYRCQFLKPDFPGGAAAKGFAYFQKGELDSAKEIFLKIVRRESEINGEIYYGLAKIYEAQDDYETAVNCYQKSLVHDPLLINSYVELAKALYKTGDYQSCILFFQQVDDVYKDHNLLISYIARSRYFLKQWDQALTDFQQIDNSPNGMAIKNEWIPKIYYIRCLIAREAGDHKAALDYFRKAKEINPDAYGWMLAALDDLGQIYTNDANYNDALSYYSRLIRLNPDDMETVMTVGKFYYYLGEIGEARRYFTYALNNESTAKRADYWLRQINSIR